MVKIFTYFDIYIVYILKMLSLELVVNCKKNYIQCSVNRKICLKLHKCIFQDVTTNIMWNDMKSNHLPLIVSRFGWLIFGNFCKIKKKQIQKYMPRYKLKKIQWLKCVKYTISEWNKIVFGILRILKCVQKQHLKHRK